jgi:hypothetical protein
MQLLAGFFKGDKVERALLDRTEHFLNDYTSASLTPRLFRFHYINEIFIAIVHQA